MIVGTLYVERLLGRGSPPTPAELSLVAHGHRFYIRIKTTDGIDLRLGAEHREFLEVLGPIVREMYHTLPPPERQATPYPGGQPPLTDTAQDWPIFYERFKNSPDLLNTMRMYFKERWPDFNPNGAPPPDTPALPSQSAQAISQLEQDLETVLAGGDEAALWRTAEAANQSEIARRLGVANAGSYRTRILAVVEALEAEAAGKEAA